MIPENQPAQSQWHAGGNDGAEGQAKPDGLYNTSMQACLNDMEEPTPKGQ